MDLRELRETLPCRHPWEVARSRFFVDQAILVLGEGTDVSVMDVGAGDGFVARQRLPRLTKGSDVVCLDPNYEDAHLDVYQSDAIGNLSFAR